MRSAVLISRGSVGDIEPLIAIGAELKSRGWRAALLANGCYTDCARANGFEFASLDAQSGVDAFLADGVLLKRPAGLIEFFQRHFLKDAKQHAELVKTMCGHNSVIVARHMATLGHLLAAEIGRIPLVEVYTAPYQVATLSVFGQLCGAVLGKSINAIRCEVGLPEICDWHRSLSSQALSVYAWPTFFDGCSGQAVEEDDCARVLYSGFLATDLKRCRPVNGGREQGHVLITGGTGYFAGRAFFEVALEACSRSGYPGLVVCARDELLPKHMPNGVQRQRWAPSLMDLVAKAPLVIHHGGMGTLAQALAAGIPQLILAEGGDRPDNGRRIYQIGAGELLVRAEWDLDSALKAIARLTLPAARTRCGALASQVTLDGAAVVADAVEAI